MYSTYLEHTVATRLKEAMLLRPTRARHFDLEELVHGEDKVESCYLFFQKHQIL
jgi:hypothetical protein